MLLLIVSHVVFRSDESDADVFEAEAESGQEADAGVDEGALVAGQLQGDEESEAAEEGELRDQQAQPLHSSPTQRRPLSLLLLRRRQRRRGRLLQFHPLFTSLKIVRIFIIY